MRIGVILFLLLNLKTALALSIKPAPVNCGLDQSRAPKSCGVQPAFIDKNESEIAHAFGFDVPRDNVRVSNPKDKMAVYSTFVNFLEKSDHSRLFYPGYFTRAAQEASVLTLKSNFVPKNPTETDEYLRCTIPSDKYWLYKKTLRPYLGLAAKASGIPFSFLACQSYVESRFNREARSSTNAIGYSQIQPSNVKYLNEILKQSLHNATQRSIASFSQNTPTARESRIRKAQAEIATIWSHFWDGTKKAPKALQECDLTCYRQVFLAQALSLKTDMLALATSSSGVKAEFDEAGDFRIEGMDKGDSLLVLAGSYNLGVGKVINLVSQFCSGSTKLKDCLDKIREGKKDKDVNSFNTYVMRIRDCAQQFSAERIDFDLDQRWSNHEKTDKLNKQREQVVQCLLNPCPLAAN